MAWLGLKNLPKSRLLAVKAAMFVLCAAPAVILVAQGFMDRLGADPVDRLTGETGETALKMLVLTLCVTPLRRLSGWNWLLRMRRMLGLFMFFYAFLHFSVYLFLDLGLDLGAVIEDVIERKYVTAGFAAFLLLWPLALTSTAWAVRKMGGQRWLKLHRAVYAVAILASVHFLWLVKGDDYGEPLVYSAIFAALLGYRWMSRDKPTQQAPARAGESG